MMQKLQKKQKKLRMNRLNSADAKRLISYIKRNGVKASVYKVIERLDRDNAEKSYTRDVFDLIDDKEREELFKTKKFTHSYKFSIIVPAYETGERRFIEMMESCFNQVYDNFELCIADASITDEINNTVIDYKEKYPERASKINYLRLSENKGISENTNEALKLATGDYIVLLDHDDVITRDALFEAMCVLEEGIATESGIRTNKVKLIYSDEDKCNDELNQFFDYHFKPDFDIDLLRTNNYICHLLIVRRELAMSVGGFIKEYDGAQDHDFIFRCVEKLKRDEIVHIPRILYHWRSHVSSTATNPDSKLYAYEAGKRAVTDHLKRLNVECEVTDTEHLGFYRVKYNVNAEDLTKVSIMTSTELKDMGYEAVMAADYEYIMILNDSVRPKNYEFVEEMLGYLKREDVGCVGGLVIGKNGKIESAGYTLDETLKLVPCFAGLNRNYSGYLHRAKLQREVDGVCTDCMMVKKSALTEELALKKEYLVIYSPYSIFKRV